MILYVCLVLIHTIHASKLLDSHALFFNSMFQFNPMTPCGRWVLQDEETIKVDEFSLLHIIHNC